MLSSCWRYRGWKKVWAREDCVYKPAGWLDGWRAVQPCVVQEGQCFWFKTIWLFKRQFISWNKAGVSGIRQLYPDSQGEKQLSCRIMFVR